MIHLLHDLPHQGGLQYDICVAGSGPAALSLALEFDRSAAGGARVALLESGFPRCGKLIRRDVGFEFRSTLQDLYQGEVVGWLRGHQPDYLTTSRLRHIGGGSQVWSGWCWPLEAHDLETRSMRGGAHWPIPYSELLTYYRRAQRTCRLGPFEYDDPGFWTRRIVSTPLAEMDLAEEPLRTRVMQLKPLDFWRSARSTIERSSRVDLWQNANLVALDSTSAPGGRRHVNAAIVRAIEGGEPGRTVRVAARHFVLAAGAIETTRLLLFAGLGDSTGHLGHNFLEHPHLWVAGRFVRDEIAQGIDNFYFPPQPVAAGRGVGIVAALVPRSEFLDAEGIGTFRIVLGGRSDVPGTLNLSWEQIPNDESRITRSEVLPPDFFGMPRVKLESRVSELDAVTLRRAITVARDVLDRNGFGHGFRLPDLDTNPWTWREFDRILPGNHPMGTTRMSAAPAGGVVDVSCRVHDTTNLYVASSSVFPTTGYANPTLTIVALAIRLADHLKAQGPDAWQW